VARLPTRAGRHATGTGGDLSAFPVIEIHPDNGSEFFNHHLVRFWKDAIKGVQISRSRPFHKNDNRFVEHLSWRRQGKNSTLVRAYFRNERLDPVTQTRLLNEIYDKMGIPKVQPLSAGHAPSEERGGHHH